MSGGVDLISPIRIDLMDKSQEILDRYTDYDNYVRCCAGHNGDAIELDQRDECCLTVTDQCCSLASNLIDQCDDCYGVCHESLGDRSHEALDSVEHSCEPDCKPDCEPDCEPCAIACEEDGHANDTETGHIDSLVTCLDRCQQPFHQTWDECVNPCETCLDGGNLPLPQAGYEGLTGLLEQVTLATESHSPKLRDPPLWPGAALPELSFDILLDHNCLSLLESHQSLPDLSLTYQDPPFQPLLQCVSGPLELKILGCDSTVPMTHSSSQPGQLEDPSSTYSVAINMGTNTRGTKDSALPNIDGAYSLGSTTSSSSSSSSNNKDSSKDIDGNNTFSSVRNLSPIVKSLTSDPSIQICQWHQADGTICGAQTENLKKHVKTHYSRKACKTTDSPSTAHIPATICHWANCSATFASESALTCHLTKTHLRSISFQLPATSSSSVTTTSAIQQPSSCSSLPPKCPILFHSRPLTREQTRDENASGNRRGLQNHCPICHQCFAGQGSNFRRHMLAKHGHRHQYIGCRHGKWGCSRSFSRSDNLKRHEACCKYGKRAAASAARVADTLGLSGSGTASIPTIDQGDDLNIVTPPHHHHHHHHHHTHLDVHADHAAHDHYHHHHHH
jgi:hypothetical protein